MSLKGKGYRFIREKPGVGVAGEVFIAVDSGFMELRSILSFFKMGEKRRFWAVFGLGVPTARRGLV